MSCAACAQRALSPAGSGKLHALLNAQPNLLGHSMAALTGKMRSLQQLLGLSDDGLHRVVARAPSLLTLTPANLQSKLRRLAQGASADVAGWQQRCCHAAHLARLQLRVHHACAVCCVLRRSHGC